jgi:hypothetical protein
MKSNRFVRLNSIFMAVVLILIYNSASVAQKKAEKGGVTGPVFRAAVLKTNITPSTPQWLRGYKPRQ